MKAVCIAICVVSVIVVLEAAPQQKKGRFDYIDLDSIFNNERVTANYIKCILDKGPCTPEGRDLKDTIPMALENLCSNCSDTEKDLARRASKHIRKNKPKEWKEIQDKYDPKGEKQDGFNKFLEGTD